MKIGKLKRAVVSAVLALCCAVSGLVFPASAAEEPDFECRIMYCSDYTTVAFKKTKASYSVYFTTDGTDPTTSSKLYTKKLGFVSAATIRVAEFDKNGERVGGYKEYEIRRKCHVPQVDFKDNLDGTAKVMITSDQKDVQIRYTTNGKDPDENSPVLEGVFKVKGNAVIKAIATKEGWVTSNVATAKTAGYVTQDSYNDYIQEAYRLTNAERKRRGLEEVKLSKALCDAAYIRAKELSKDYDRGHTRLNDTEWHTAITEQGYIFKFAGENYGKLAVKGVKADVMVQMWIESPIHLENIINEFGGDVGIGFYQDGDFCYWVQLFAKKK